MRALIFAVALFISASCQAQSSLSTGDRASLENRANFRMLNAATPLPRDLFQLCADHNGLLAAPGEHWNPIDVMVGGLPSRRVIWAARSKELFVVHYEQGGFFHSYHIVVARFKPQASSYELGWRAEAPRLLQYSDFVVALKNNELRPEAPLITGGPNPTFNRTWRYIASIWHPVVAIRRLT